LTELSAELAALFPQGAVAAQLHGSGSPADLTQVEKNSVRHCSGKRISDFSAGRACARLGLRELGIEGFSLLSAKDRQPVWPAGITGSVTHTDGYTAAVVIRQGRVRSVGVDSEAVGAVHEGLWPRVCTQTELESLRSFASPERAVRAALIFTAKEAFYKSQFPLTAEWIGFQDVAIELQEEPGGGGVFVVAPQRALRLPRQAEQGLSGRFRRHGEFVTAGIALC
jgi:enterobactin synthetase component D / holo-[acyl-carrier protein] synthase